MGSAEEKTEQIIRATAGLIEPVLAANGMELVDIEYRRESPGWVLRLFIDQPNGITVDDCAKVSRVLGDLLDVADVIQTAYDLEVSSPGLNRPLRKPEHYRAQMGNIVEVRTTEPLGNRRKFKGVLVDSGEDWIRLNCDGQEFEIALNVIERARLRYFETQELKA
jgi:ribosome maturation factor RimP